MPDPCSGSRAWPAAPMAQALSGVRNDRSDRAAARHERDCARLARSLAARHGTDRASLRLDDTTYRSPNFGSRNGATVDKVVIHYTAGSMDSTIGEFVRPGGTSAHYVIPDSSDAGFMRRHPKTQVFQMVDEGDRAWHAGAGAWKDDADVNTRSIGIEIVNLASDQGGNLTFPAYKTDQIRALHALLSDIVRRYPDILPSNIIGHSDMTSRKSDPGPQFPWETLGRAGLGGWYDEPTVSFFLQEIDASRVPVDRASIVGAMHEYGYAVSNRTSDAELSKLVRSFQMHFCPDECGYMGEINKVTAATLYAVCFENCQDYVCEHILGVTTPPALNTTSSPANATTAITDPTSLPVVSGAGRPRSMLGQVVGIVTSSVAGIAAPLAAAMLSSAAAMDKLHELRYLGVFEPGETPSRKEMRRPVE